MTEKEKFIINSMKALDISREEAIELWEDDHSNEDLEEVKEMTDKARKNAKRYEKSSPSRKKSTKERKVDTTKKELIDIVCEALKNTVEIKEIKTETEINFDFNGENFTFKLTRHKKK